MPEIPRRLADAERQRKIDRSMRDLRKGHVAGFGIIEGRIVIMDENETVRLVIGQVGSESQPQYDVLRYDENGDLIGSAFS